MRKFLCSLAQCTDQFTRISLHTFKRLVAEIQCANLCEDDQCKPLVERNFDTKFCIPIHSMRVADLNTEIRANLDRIYLLYCDQNTEYGRSILIDNMQTVLVHYANEKLISNSYSVECEDTETELINVSAHYTLVHATSATQHRPDFEFKDVAAFENVVIDIETFGTKPNTIIHEIALTFFNNDELGMTYSWKVNWQKQDQRFWC